LKKGTLTRVYAIGNVTNGSMDAIVHTLAAGTDLFDQDVKHRLVMITCGGPFDRHTHRYRDNVVIVATPVKA
jgi:hypothetical protein